MLFRFITIFTFVLSSLNAATIPVVTAEENGRLEDLADETGANEWRFMKNAGHSVAIQAEKMVHNNKDSKIVVLVGKGYNGGNALWAGLELKKKNYNVIAYFLFPIENNPTICQEVAKQYEAIGGKYGMFYSDLEYSPDLIIDGILGASFQGGADGVLANAINWANNSKAEILSVDIPSGLNGDTGLVGTVGIHAQHTVTFFFPRVGFFIREGWNHVGSLSVINLGIGPDILALINPEAYLLTDQKSKKSFELENVKMDRKEYADLLGFQPEYTFDEYQKFANENNLTFVLTDEPMMKISPEQMPLIYSEVPLFKFSDSGEMKECLDFFEEFK